MSTEIATAVTLASEGPAQQTMETVETVTQTVGAAADAAAGSAQDATNAAAGAAQAGADSAAGAAGDAVNVVVTAAEDEVQVARSPQLVREATETCNASASTGHEGGEETVEPISRGFLSKKAYGIIPIWNKRYFAVGEEPMPLENLGPMFKKLEKKTKHHKEAKAEKEAEPAKEEAGKEEGGSEEAGKLAAIEEEKNKPDEPANDEVKAAPVDEYENINQSLFRNIATATTVGKGLLFYYSHEKDTSPHGIINLADISTVEASPKVKNHSFTMKSSAREWVLAAHSEKECQRWLKTLNEQVKAAKESQVESSDAYKEIYKRLVSKQAFEKVAIVTEATTEPETKEKLTTAPESKRKSYFQMLTGGLKRAPKEAAEVHAETVEDVKIKSLELGDDVNLTKEMEAATEKIVEDVKTQKEATQEAAQETAKEATQEATQEARDVAKEATDTTEQVTKQVTETVTPEADTSKAQEAVKAEAPAAVAVVEEVKQTKRKSFLPFSFKKEAPPAPVPVTTEETQDIKQEVSDSEGKEESKNAISRAMSNMFKRGKKEEAKIVEGISETAETAEKTAGEAAEKTGEAAEKTVGEAAEKTGEAAGKATGEVTETTREVTGKAEEAATAVEAKPEQVVEAAKVSVAAAEKEVGKAEETAEKAVVTEVEKTDEIAAKVAEPVAEGASRRKSMLKGFLFKGKKEVEAKTEEIKEVKEEAKDAVEQAAEAVDEKKKGMFAGFTLFKTKTKEIKEEPKEEAKGEEVKEEAKGEEAKEEAKGEGSVEPTPKESEVTEATA